MMSDTFRQPKFFNNLKPIKFKGNRKHNRTYPSFLPQVVVSFELVAVYSSTFSTPYQTFDLCYFRCHHQAIEKVCHGA